jgi:outer membrane cobalamin receptor
MRIENQLVRPDAICMVPEIHFTSELMAKATDIVFTAMPQYDQGNEHMEFLSAEDIAVNVHRTSLVDLLNSMTTDIQKTESGDLLIRGSRPGDVIYFVDGVKMNGLANVPGTSIGGVAVYTGGVPAKYGDTTGGVIIMETKSYFDLYRAWKMATSAMN